MQIEPKKIYNFEIIKEDDDNYDEYKRMADALELIENSNFFIPDEIEEINTDELHAFKKPDQLELYNRSQHDILLDMFTMAVHDNDKKMFGNCDKRFNVKEFHKLFQTILNVTNKNNPIICPKQKEKTKPKETKNNEKDNNDDAAYVPNESENEDD